MASHTINLTTLGLKSTLRFIRQLRPIEGVDTYHFDVAKLQYVSPFGMLMASLALRRFRGRLPKCDFDILNHQDQTYPAHMGFFKAFGADFGRAPGEASGSDRYLPITLLDLNDLRRRAREDAVQVQDVIERHTEHLAALLTQDQEDQLSAVLAYSMREIFRNVLEHSKASQIGYAAQYWPSKDLVEVAILDSGIGINAGLSLNPHLEIQDDSHALRLSILPGVSGVSFAGSPQGNGYWANSGFGLFMTSGLCRKGGDFVILSGEAGMKLDMADSEHFQCELSGTAVRLRLKPSNLGSLRPELSNLRRQGEEIARDIKGATPSASAASALLGRLSDD